MTSTSRGLVLVIDDEKFIRESIRITLERTGYSVRLAANGRDAELQYADDLVDIVICDLLMPERNGIDTIRAIRERNKTVKIIAISGGNRSEGSATLAHAIEAGANVALPKPFGARELLKTIDSLLNQ